MKKPQHTTARGEREVLDDTTLEAATGGGFRDLFKKFMEGYRDGALQMEHAGGSGIVDIPDGVLA